MHKYALVFPAVLALGLSHMALAKNAQDILETARQKQLERWQGVDVYLVEQSMMGNSARTWFQRTEVTSDNGETETLFVPLPEAQVRAGQCPGAQQMTPEGLDAYARGLDMTGNVMAGEIENGLEQMGLPRGLLAASGSDPTATFDPRVMLGSGAVFVRGAANAQRQQAASDPTAGSRQDMAHMALFMKTAQLKGTESVDGRTAYLLQASGLNQVQNVDGREYRMDTMRLWIDNDTYAPLKMRVDGTLIAGAESKPMSIETIQSDYRNVPDSKMYESYRQVMKISGLMDAAQEAEMREAQTKMAEFEKQLASMPPGQRQMMEKMMGPQLETMRSMASGGGFQTETVVRLIAVNPDISEVGGAKCQVGNANR